MKKFLSLALILCSLISFAQKAPEKGDYLMISFPKGETGSFIFRKSNKVYYNYSFNTKKAGNKYKQSAQMVKDLFLLADSLGLNKIFE